MMLISSTNKPRWIWNRFVGVSQEEQVLNFSGSQAAVGLFRWIGRSPRLINDIVEFCKVPLTALLGRGERVSSRHSQFMFQSPCLRSEGNMEVFKLETGCSGCVPPVPVANTGGGCVGRNVWRSRPTWSSRDIL